MGKKAKKILGAISQGLGQAAELASGMGGSKKPKVTDEGIGGAPSLSGRKSSTRFGLKTANRIVDKANPNQGFSIMGKKRKKLI